MDPVSFEEVSGPVERRARCVLRRVRWWGKSVFGLPRHIVVEVRWRLGDEVMALPVYEGLKAAHPKSRLTVLCNHPDLLVDNPHVNSVNTVAGPVDRYVLLRSDARSIPRIEHYARLAGIPTPKTRPRLYYANWSTHLLDGVRRPFVAVSTGASWPSKRWPMDRWREVCEEIHRKGYTVVELGVEGEQIGVGIDRVGRTSVAQAACILHAATLFLCCDSGLMHLALAAGTPVLALFGPTDPAILVGEEPGFFPLPSESPCRGCWNVSQTMTVPGICPENRSICLESISVDRVLRHVETVLDSRSSHSHERVAPASKESL